MWSGRSTAEILDKLKAAAIGSDDYGQAVEAITERFRRALMPLSISETVALANALQAEIAASGQSGVSRRGATAAALNPEDRRWRDGDASFVAAPVELVRLAVTPLAAALTCEEITPREAEVMIKTFSQYQLGQRLDRILGAAKRSLGATGLPAEWRRVLAQLPSGIWGVSPSHRAMVDALFSRSGAGGASGWVGPLAAIVDAAIATNPAWQPIIAAISEGSGGSKPNAAFAKRAAGWLAAIGRDTFVADVTAWLAAHPLDPARPDPEADAVKQLVWALGFASAAAPLGSFADRCFTKVPNLGARSTKLGNAALHALALVEPPTAGAAELDRLLRRVKTASARSAVEAALQVAAARAGMTADDLAELATPDLGLDAAGERRFDGEDGRAVLRLIAGRSAVLDWFDATDKALKAPPAALKAGNPALLKAARTARDELERALGAAVARIEAGYESNRDWPFATWRERFLGHRLLAPLAARLVWQVTRGDGSTASGRPMGDALIDNDGSAVTIADTDRIALWHPIDADVETVLAWRAALAAAGIVQPFKQAHREIYRLTDAERETDTYSNRFAGHILRQHQMLELAKARGWTGTLQGGFDNHNNPEKAYKAFGLQVEYWSEGIHTQEDDLSHAGICIRVATDQVRFRRLRPVIPPRTDWERERELLAAWYNAPPVRLVDIPPRLFSEAMRDVDLFVGVASIGADPGWRDGGPDGRFGTYWQGYANADLTASGETRAAVLSALLPRLALGKVARIDGRHLVVTGKRFSYRIHMGSGSILVEPGGQYLCIVADRRAADEDIALPFEGDAMLAQILSKALLLAADDRIEDASILSQLASLERR